MKVLRGRKKNEKNGKIQENKQTEKQAINKPIFKQTRTDSQTGIKNAALKYFDFQIFIPNFIGVFLEAFSTLTAI